MQREDTRRLSRRPSPGWLWPLVVSLIFLCAAPRLAPAASVTFAWDPNTESGLNGYRLHYGLASRTYATHVNVANVITGGVITATVDGLADGITYYFAVTAYDASNESGYSNEVVYTPPLPPPPPETVSQPAPPDGPTSVQAGLSYVFTAGGAISSHGHAIQYRFLWSDGTTSDWLPPGTIEAAKSWDVPAAYTAVQVEARCADHPSVVSDPSNPITVTVEAAPAETVSQPSPPAGPALINDRGQHTYTTGGSVASTGHTVEYRFLWGDGTVSDWLPAGQLAIDRSWSLPGTYSVRTEARCQSHPTVRSTPSAVMEVRVEAPPEVVTAPNAPLGPGGVRTGLVYGYTTRSAASSYGDPLQYRMYWGDGTASPWISPGSDGAIRAWKSWAAEGIYDVVAEARCALHPGLSVISAASAVSVSGGDALLLADTFSDGTPSGDPQWKTLSGKWMVGADGTFTSAGLKAINRAVVRALAGFRAGRISTKVKLSRESLTRATGIVFALKDAQHYRYVAISGSRVFIGQAGDTPSAKAGVKASANRKFRAGQWYQLRADLHPDGRVLVFLGKERKPVLTYRFANAVPGSIGCLAQQSVTYFDDFRAWDARVLR